MASTLRKTSNQTLGRGKIFMKKQSESGYRYLGNTPAFSVTVTTESLKHFNSDTGVKTQDKEVPISTEYAGALTTDNVNHENLAMMLLGSAATVSVSSTTGATKTFANVKQGYLYDLGNRKVSNVVVKVSAATKVVDTDYTLDAERGHLTIIEGGGIADDASVDVTFDVAAHSYDKSVSAGNAVEGTILFRADNPEGDDIDYVIPDAKLTPNGEFQIKAEEWQQLPFNISISVPDDGSPAISANGQPYTP